MQILNNPIQTYAWGSHTALADLLGCPPSSEPQAELWIGAHPRAPSTLADGRSLLDAIQSDPQGTLGVDVARRFGRLPFLLKVLAVDSPLSLQAHPNLVQARAGFAREQAAGTPLDAPQRTYKDDNHKPELLCALTPFEALSGFRAPEDAAHLLGSLGLQTFDLLGTLRDGGSQPMRAAFCALMTLPPQRRTELVDEATRRCRSARNEGGPFSAAFDWVVKLSERYPGDVGAIASLLLNHLQLKPLQAIYLEAGRLHAYLSGVGVEIMANSDNVLRGGLTPKHVDVAELMSVLRFDTPTIAPVAVTAEATNPEESGEAHYATPIDEFALSRIELRTAHGLSISVAGPELLLCVQGTAQVTDAAGHPLTLSRGNACFVSAADSGYRIEGSGEFFRARVRPHSASEQ
jgi:mannose-6-phosphate isomerase